MNELTRRAFTMLMGTSLAALVSRGVLGASAPAAAPQAATDFDIMPYVNPQFRELAATIKKMGFGSITADNLSTARGRSPTIPPLAEPAWTEKLIPGPRGAPDVRVYVINARSSQPARPAILHMHGGGFVLGNAKAGIANLQAIAQALACVIVTVDYRIAPETKFPASLEDNYAALRWLHRKAPEMGVDPSRIAVMGESAGGGHAAMLAIAARDRGEIPVIYQALIYPMLDDRTGSTRKTPPYQGVLVWNPGSNRFGWTSLLGVPAGSSKVPYGAVPARLSELRGLPPAFIGVGSIDLFVDEDIDYARRLVDSGIAVDLHVVPGGFHGFDAAPDSSLAQNFKASLLDALRRAFESADTAAGQPQAPPVAPSNKGGATSHRGENFGPHATRSFALGIGRCGHFGPKT
jgi:acetyl esterase/lipase